MKLIWILPHPTHYWIYFFNKLAETKIIDFEVVFSNKVIESYPWAFNYDIKFHYTISSNKLLLNLRLFREFFKRDRIFVSSGWDTLGINLIVLISIVLKKNFAFCTDTIRTSRDMNKIRETLRYHYLRFLITKASFILTTGQVGVDIFTKYFSITKNVYNFPFTTNNDFFMRNKKYEIKTNEIFRILSSGRLIIGHKGYDIALQALGRFKKRNKLFNFEYLIAGSGIDKDKIIEMIKKNDLINEVKLIGWIDHLELPTFYSSGHLFLHASRFDPFPNAVLEAMACSLPVLGSDQAGSVLERVINNENGLIFKGEDVEDLTRKFEFLIKNPELLSKMSNQARKTAEKWDVSYNIKLINSVINIIGR